MPNACPATAATSSANRHLTCVVIPDGASHIPALIRAGLIPAGNWASGRNAAPINISSDSDDVGCDETRPRCL